MLLILRWGDGPATVGVGVAAAVAVVVMMVAAFIISFPASAL